MERKRLRIQARRLFGTFIATALLSIPTTAIAQRTTGSFASPAPSEDSIRAETREESREAPEPQPNQPALVDWAPPAGEVVSTVGQTANFVGQHAVLIQVEPQLLIQGNDAGHPLVVDATPKDFASWSEFFDHAQNQLGATLISNDQGEVVAATGEYTRTGSVVFDDAGEQFESLDYVAAHLGGLAGSFVVAGQTIAVSNSATAPEGSVFLLEQTDVDCEDEHCIQGHSWLTQAWVYHSVGSRTKQISGGTSTVWSTICTRGVPAFHEGESKCRVIVHEEWVYNPQTDTLEPVGELAADSYIYEYPVPHSYDRLNNRLSVRLQALNGVFVDRIVGPKTAEKVTEIEISGWTVVKNSLDDNDGVPIPLRDVSGVCGIHSSSDYLSAPGEDGWSLSLETADGSTGEEDVLCGETNPF